MLINQTTEKLKSLRLHGMVECLLSQAGEPSSAGLSFEERLGLLVDYECTYRDNRRLQKLLKNARLKLDACLEDPTLPPRGEGTKEHPRAFSSFLFASASELPFDCYGLHIPFHWNFFHESSTTAPIPLP